MFVAVPYSFQDHRNMKIHVALLDVFAFDEINDGLSVFSGGFVVVVVEISHGEEDLVVV